MTNAIGEFQDAGGFPPFPRLSLAAQLPDKPDSTRWLSNSLLDVALRAPRAGSLYVLRLTQHSEPDCIPMCRVDLFSLNGLNLLLD